MALGFERTAAGAYIRKFRFGYEAVLVKMDGKWQGTIRDGEGKPVEGFLVCQRLLKDAKGALVSMASNINVPRRNALTDAPIMVSITTPVSCDPSMESYFSM